MMEVSEPPTAQIANVLRSLQPIVSFSPVSVEVWACNNDIRGSLIVSFPQTAD